MVLMAGVILCLDFLTKSWVNDSLPLMGPSFPHYPYGGIPVFHNFLGIEFSISHMTNRGAAWGVLNDYQLTLVVGRIFLILGMLTYLLFFNRNLAWRLPLVLIIVGAIGNIIDFFVFGHVVDMLHFVLWGYDFPVFNIADSSVTIGVMWLFLLSLKQEMQFKSAR